MLAVARWFLSTLYGSFRSRCENQMEKKPFNPILGETFNCSWKDTNNKGWIQSHINVEQGTIHVTSISSSTSRCFCCSNSIHQRKGKAVYFVARTLWTENSLCHIGYYSYPSRTSPINCSRRWLWRYVDDFSFTWNVGCRVVVHVCVCWVVW